jgi:O-antigen ligase
MFNFAGHLLIPRSHNCHGSAFCTWSICSHVRECFHHHISQTGGTTHFTAPQCHVFCAFALWMLLLQTGNCRKLKMHYARVAVNIVHISAVTESRPRKNVSVFFKVLQELVKSWELRVERTAQFQTEGLDFASIFQTIQYMHYLRYLSKCLLILKKTFIRRKAGQGVYNSR